MDFSKFSKFLLVVAVFGLSLTFSPRSALAVGNATKFESQCQWALGDTNSLLASLNQLKSRNTPLSEIEQLAFREFAFYAAEDHKRARAASPAQGNSDIFLELVQLLPKDQSTLIAKSFPVEIFQSFRLILLRLFKDPSSLKWEDVVGRFERDIRFVPSKENDLIERDNAIAELERGELRDYRRYLGALIQFAVVETNHSNLETLNLILGVIEWANKSASLSSNHLLGYLALGKQKITNLLASKLTETTRAELLVLKGRYQEVYTGIETSLQQMGKDARALRFDTTHRGRLELEVSRLMSAANLNSELAHILTHNGRFRMNLTFEELAIYIGQYATTGATLSGIRKAIIASLKSDRLSYDEASQLILASITRLNTIVAKNGGANGLAIDAAAPIVREEFLRFAKLMKIEVSTQAPTNQQAASAGFAPPAIVNPAEIPVARDPNIAASLDLITQFKEIVEKPYEFGELEKESSKARAILEKVFQIPVPTPQVLEEARGTAQTLNGFGMISEEYFEDFLNRLTLRYNQVIEFANSDPNDKVEADSYDTGREELATLIARLEEEKKKKR